MPQARVPISIRHADPQADASGCLAVYLRFVSDSVVSFEERVPTVAEFSERIARLSTRYPWIVADYGEQITGYAYASRHRAGPPFDWVADVSVYVAAAARRRGVGRALYVTLLELLRRQGIRSVAAAITLPNEPSVALHESLGFRFAVLLRAIGWKLGDWRDVGWWHRELVAPGAGPPSPLGPPPRLA